MLGKGAAYETSMRDHSPRPHLPRRLQGRAAGEEAVAVEERTRRACSSALAADNMFWRLHAQRLLVERGQKDVVPQLIALARNQSVDEIGINGGAFHALVDAARTRRARTRPGERRISRGGRRVEASGGRRTQGGRDGAAAHGRSRAGDPGRGLLHDPDLHTRLAAMLAIADMPTSAEIGQALYAESRRPTTTATSG